jgi:hypothetical protein
MSKARTAKLLVTAAANIAVVGMAASPASASALLVSGPAAEPSAPAGGPHPGIAVVKVDEQQGVNLSPEQAPLAFRATTRRADTSAAKPAGFVPKASRGGAVPDTETGCSGYVCLGLYGGANHVSYVNTSWTTGTGCHIGHIDVYYQGNAISTYSSPTYICRNQEYQIDFNASYPTGTSFCGYFNNIAGLKCEEVR